MTAYESVADDSGKVIKIRLIPILTQDFPLDCIATIMSYTDSIQVWLDMQGTCRFLYNAMRDWDVAWALPRFKVACKEFVDYWMFKDDAGAYHQRRVDLNGMEMIFPWHIIRSVSFDTKYYRYPGFLLGFLSMCSQLREIYLCAVQLPSQECAMFEEILIKFGSSLQVLYLDGFEPSDLYTLGVPMFTPATLAEDNDVKDPFIKSLAKVFSNLKKLRILNVSDNPSIDYMDIVSILRNTSCRIKDLYIDHCEIFNDEMTAIVAALGDNDSVEKFSAAWNGDGGGYDVLLEKNKTLKCLNLRGVELGNETLIEICKGLRSNYTLKELDLSYTSITSIGMNAFAEAMRVNKTLCIVSFLSFCSVAGGFPVIVRAVKESARPGVLLIHTDYESTKSSQVEKIKDILHVSDKALRGNVYMMVHCRSDEEATSICGLGEPEMVSCFRCHTPPEFKKYEKY